MDVKVECLGPVKRKIDVVIPPEKVAEEVELLYRQLKKSVRIKGFRSGKVPEHILKRYYRDQVEGEVISKLIQGSYPDALQRVSMVPISQPVLENGGLEEGKEFFYSASFEVKPEIAVKDYLSLKVEKERVKVTEKDVEERIEKLREAHAFLKEVEEERLLKVGDYTLVDIKGTVQGKVFEGGEVNDHLLELGPDTYLPGLSRKLIGFRKGSSAEVVLSIPEDYYRKDLAGREVSLQVTIKGIKEKVLPPLDDAFARDVGECKGLDDLKKMLEVRIEREEQGKVESLVRRRIEDQLITTNPFEVPPSMIERQIEFMMADTERVLLSQGSSLGKLGISVEALRENYRTEAERKVRCSLVLQTIAAREGIEVREGEIEEKLKDIAHSNNQSVDRVRDFYRREGLWEGLTITLRENKTYEFLLKSATIEDVARDEKN